MQCITPLPPEEFFQLPGCRVILRERNDPIPTTPLPSFSGSTEIRVKGCNPPDGLLVEMDRVELGYSGAVFHGNSVLDCNTNRRTSVLAVEAPEKSALRRDFFRRFYRKHGRCQISVKQACYLVAQPNYAAWLLGEVPRLRHYQRFLQSGFKLLVHGEVRPHHLQTLEHCGVGREHMVVVPPETDIAAESLIYSSPAYCDHIPSPLGVGFLRSLASPSSPHDPGRRYYLGRMNCPLRRIVNEDVAQQALARLGFEPLAPESLPVAKQIGLFASAEMIVAPFGAALANMAFSSQSVRVCVIRTKFTNEFARLAHLAGVRLSVFDKLKRSKRGINFSASKKELHQVFSVDVDALIGYVHGQLEGS